MNTIRYRPVSLLRELQNELFPLLSTNDQAVPQESALGVWAPKVDIKEEENEFVVYADIPGVDPKEIEIEMSGSTLTIKGERKSEQEEKGKNYYRVECTTGKFFRQFTLPDNVDTSKISAKNKHGVLMVHVPKEKENKHYRKIQIEEGH